MRTPGRERTERNRGNGGSLIVAVTVAVDVIDSVVTQMVGNLN